MMARTRNSSPMADIGRRGLVEQAADGVGGELSVAHVELVLAVYETRRSAGYVHKVRVEV